MSAAEPGWLAGGRAGWLAAGPAQACHAASRAPVPAALPAAVGATSPCCHVAEVVACPLSPPPPTPVTQGELVELGELPVKRASVARFSNGGHLLAAAGRNNVISLHQSWSRQQVALLRGHASSVTDLSFAPGGGSARTRG
jgi:hypothetical protein